MVDEEHLKKEREKFAKDNLKAAYKGTELSDENGKKQPWPDPVPKTPEESEAVEESKKVQLEDQRLNRNQQNLTSAISVFYWENKTIPSNDKLAELTGMTVGWIERTLREPLVVSALRARGIYTEDFSQAYLQSGSLTAQQTACVDLMLNLTDKRTKREKLKQIGVSTARYYAWMNQPAFKDYMNKRARELFGAHEHDGYLAVLRSMEAGSMDAAKFYFELAGIYNPKITVQVDVNHIVTQVVEIVLARVKDAETVKLIAQDLSKLTSEQPRNGLQNMPGMSPLALTEGLPRGA